MGNHGVAVVRHVTAGEKHRASAVVPEQDDRRIRGVLSNPQDTESPGDERIKVVVRLGTCWESPTRTDALDVFEVPTIAGFGTEVLKVSPTEGYVKLEGKLRVDQDTQLLSPYS